MRPAAEQLVVSGEVGRVSYENEQTGYRVIRLVRLEAARVLTEPLTVVGVLPPLGTGLRVRVTGTLEEDPRHGLQLRASTLVVLAPETLAALERHLGSGVLPGIGAGFAKKIVEHFGSDTLTVLDASPERLAEVPGLGKKRATEAARAWLEQRVEGAVVLELAALGLGPSIASRVVRRFGARAAEIARASPYRLALEVAGVGFRTADRIARTLGLRGDHPDRVEAGVLHQLELFADQGHIATPRELLVTAAAELLEIDVAHVEAGLSRAWGSERLVIDDGAVYLPRHLAAERSIGEGLVRLRGAVKELPSAEALAAFERGTGMALAPQQRAAVELVAREPIVVITGGPGVGKTTIVRAVLALFRNARLEVALAAPTGRAAKRLGEATLADARTLHRLLEVEPRTGRFQRCAESPLVLDALIVDEASMVDAQLMASLVDALPDHARLVLVGDVDQLPSVGPGAVLRDFIGSGAVPTARLTEVFRQAAASHIVQNAHRIHGGEAPVSADADDPSADFFVLERRTPEEAAATIRTLVCERIPRRFGLDPLRDVQVLTPMHKGTAGTAALNELLQATLNPGEGGLAVGAARFRVGDKVMQLKNDYDRDVFNGDVGRVVELDVEGRTLVAAFDERRVSYEDQELEALTLAYATSVHKSQGSEYPAVVIPLLTSHFVMLSRNLLYTAVTRARRLCVLVADPRALRLALAEMRREERRTGLAARLAMAR